jgi:PKD repeat protein
MLRKLLSLALLITGLGFTAYAQEKCLTEIMYREEAAKNPRLVQDRQLLEEFTEQFVKDWEQNKNANKGSAVNPIIIPVVVHVIHFGGPENISKAQILDQIRILNEDFRRLNADTVNTPAAFQAVAGDANVEFRMAQKDPNGNCTDGILRVYSPLTFNARNNVKALSYWPSNKYLNMWIVSSIENTSGLQGDVIGFAQFPGTGTAATDGVVIKHDFMGGIGTAAGSGNNGRTATHEVGHWLNLRHIWGDATCGNDFVSDTPPHEAANFGCPSFPHLSSCTGNPPNGDMYPNYMDYTDGDCQNIFSNGQIARMTATLNSSISGRNNLWTQNNLIATGTDGTPPVLCSPVADWAPNPRFICEGAFITFRDESWGGEATSRVWSFPGGTPSTDTSALPTVTYNTAGVYDVSLTVTNATGTNTKTLTGQVVVSPNSIPNATIPFAEGFESGSLASDWYISNLNGGSAWEVNNAAAKTGTYSINLFNYLTANDKGPDEFMTQAYNFSNVTGLQMSFDLAYATYPPATTDNDVLTVSYSTTCGRLWTQRYSKTGTALQTTTAGSSGNFVPTSASQWRTEVISLTTTAVSTKPNVRFRFLFNHDNGNNIFIDNINLTGTVGLDQVTIEPDNVNVYPNPTTSDAFVQFNTFNSGRMRIEISDALGRVVSTFEDMLMAGEHTYSITENLDKGVYFVRLISEESDITKKLVIR